MNSVFDEHRLAEYADSELACHIHSSSRISPDYKVSIILPNLVAKHISKRDAADELEGIQFAQQLKLRVLSIKRVIHKDKDVYI